MAINLTTFAKNLTYQADTSVSQIFKDLKELAEIKQLAEQKVAYFSTLAGWSWVGIVLIIIGLFFASSNALTNWIGFGYFLLAILIVPAIFCSSKWGYYGKLKMRDYRYELPKKILSMVNRDRTPNSNVEILIYFTPAGEMGKKIQTLPHPRKRGWKVDCFEDQWLTLEGEFIDRSNFSLTVTELNRKAYGQNANGKSKSKHKPKGTEINLKLSFPSKKYGSIHVIQKAAPEAVKLPVGAKLKRMKVTPKAIDLTVNTPRILNQEEMYQTITMMFLSLYQVLNFAKILSRRRRALPET
ncbi:hypothetical protein [Microcoleus sp. herbarium14]|uniref:hypothetical protein n=1 Tax=Microcoleus sp. herbarium14 TaxID=3055439 RepID=UPI002FD79D82